MKITVDFSRFKLPEINRVIKLFISADLLFISGWAIIKPLFAVFVVSEIRNATVVTVGILAGIFWVTRAVLQVPISLFLDRMEGERDDFYSLIFGLMIISISAFGFMLAQSIWHVYLIVFIKGIGFSLYSPSWCAIFSRHLDKDHTAFDWALHSSAVSLSIGVAGFIGGWLVLAAGFKIVFLIVGLLALTAASLLLFVPDLILPRKVTAEPTIPPPISITKGRHV